MQMMASMTGAASVLNKKSGTMENTMVKLHCPKILNLKKIRTLTAEPTKKMAFDLIMKYYEETTKSDNNGNETVEYKLKENISTSELDKLAAIFDGVGYFKAADVLAASASDLAGQAKNKLAGFFSKNASLNEAANIVVFSEETYKQLKINHNIDIDNYKDRQRVFEGSYAMILIKIDREYERFTFYINGQPLGSSINKNELKQNSNKNSGMDIAEMMQILNKANQTSLF